MADRVVLHLAYGMSPYSSRSLSFTVHLTFRKKIGQGYNNLLFLEQFSAQ